MSGGDVCPHSHQQAFSLFRLRRCRHRATTQPLNLFMNTMHAETINFEPHDNTLDLDVDSRRAQKQRVNENKLAKRLIRETGRAITDRSEEHTSALQSLMRNSYAGFCLKKKNNN